MSAPNLCSDSGESNKIFCSLPIFQNQVENTPCYRSIFISESSTKTCSIMVDEQYIDDELDIFDDRSLSCLGVQRKDTCQSYSTSKVEHLTPNVTLCISDENAEMRIENEFIARLILIGIVEDILRHEHDPLKLAQILYCEKSDQHSNFQNAIEAENCVENRHLNSVSNDACILKPLFEQNYKLNYFGNKISDSVVKEDFILNTMENQIVEINIFEKYNSNAMLCIKRLVDYPLLKVLPLKQNLLVAYEPSLVESDKKIISSPVKYEMDDSVNNLKSKIVNECHILGPLIGQAVEINVSDNSPKNNVTTSIEQCKDGNVLESLSKNEYHDSIINDQISASDCIFDLNYLPNAFIGEHNTNDMDIEDVVVDETQPENLQTPTENLMSYDYVCTQDVPLTCQTMIENELNGSFTDTRNKDEEDDEDDNDCDDSPIMLTFNSSNDLKFKLKTHKIISTQAFKGLNEESEESCDIKYLMQKSQAAKEHEKAQDNKYDLIADDGVPKLIEKTVKDRNIEAKVSLNSTNSYQARKIVFPSFLFNRPPRIGLSKFEKIQHLHEKYTNI